MMVFCTSCGLQINEDDFFALVAEQRAAQGTNSYEHNLAFIT